VAEHILKTWPPYFDAVKRGEKTFEGRKNDRNFQPGDTVVLQRTQEDICWRVDCDEDGKAKHELRFRIGYVLKGGEFGIEEGYCVFSLLPLEPRA
jgi:hypothetical protein